jgi:hypothetical protein
MFQTLSLDQLQSGNPNHLRSVEKVNAAHVDVTWREMLRKDADRLYEIASSFKGNLDSQTGTALLAEAEHLYNKIEHFSHSSALLTARWHLLNGASDVISALQAGVVGNDNMAKAYMNAAKIELGFYDIELARSGAY